MTVDGEKIVLKIRRLHLDSLEKSKRYAFSQKKSAQPRDRLRKSGQLEPVAIRRLKSFPPSPTALGGMVA